MSAYIHGMGEPVGIKLLDLALLEKIFKQLTLGIRIIKSTNLNWDSYKNKRWSAVRPCIKKQLESGQSRLRNDKYRPGI
jgi:hypothetical protein